MVRLYLNDSVIEPFRDTFHADSPVAQINKELRFQKLGALVAARDKCFLALAFHACDRCAAWPCTAGSISRPHTGMTYHKPGDLKEWNQV